MGADPSGIARAPQCGRHGAAAAGRAPVVYNGDPLRDLSLVNFLDAFVQRKPKVCDPPAPTCYLSPSKSYSRQHMWMGKSEPVVHALLPRCSLLASSFCFAAVYF